MKRKYMAFVGDVSSGEMVSKVDEILAEWTKAGWRLEHVNQSREGYKNMEFGFFWVKDD